MRASELQETTAERFAMIPSARVDNGDEDMEDMVSDQNAPSAQDAMETSATDRIPNGDYRHRSRRL